MRAEVDIGLVDDNHAVLVMLQKILKEIQRYAASGRRVWIGKDNAAVRLVVVADAHTEIPVQRHGFVRDAEQIAPDRIERIGDIRIKDRPVRAEKRLKGKRKHIV